MILKSYDNKSSYVSNMYYLMESSCKNVVVLTYNSEGWSSTSRRGLLLDVKMDLYAAKTRSSVFMTFYANLLIVLLVSLYLPKYIIIFLFKILD